MLVNSREVLQQAKMKGVAIVAPDFIDLDSARCFVQVAEDLNRPIILSFAQAHHELISLEEAALIGKLLAKNAKVPIVLHLDHGTDFDFIRQAIDAGFTSVMMDASMESFAENVRKTQEVVAYAHARDVTVEAEIGHVGSGDNYENHEHTDSIYTDVNQAIEFAKLTQIDSMAVSIGTAHGAYKGVPKINYERLEEIRNALTIPLVLHGGSGSGNENLRNCAHQGISKINIFTDFLVAAMNEITINQASDYLSLKNDANGGMKKVMRHYIELLSL